MRDYTPPPVDARRILRSPVHFIAFGFGTGLSPKGPGTVGTLAALPIYLLLNNLSWSGYIAGCAILFLFGCWVCGESARRLGVHDHGGIVFDEIVAFLVVLAPYYWVTWSPVNLVAAFLVFRFFDIVKPWPIKFLDSKVHGGFGIMIDDLIAAIFTVVLVFLPSELGLW
ncbi:MAG: phosphatidylglycerophosphatase A [Pseudomonadota bacterium]